MDVTTLLDKVGGTLHAGRSFGPVIERDGCLVVPVAITAGGGGGGGELGTRPDGAGGEGGDGDLNGGGGFGGVSWPVGVYVVKDGDVRWVPAVDVTRVALGALALVRAVVRIRARRARRG